MQLKLERKSQPNATVVIGAASISPLVDEDYWEYRVIVGEHQAVVGFPKYTTIGIGFAVEENWNTNLPYSLTTERIWNHIKDNKGEKDIPDEWCIKAIRLIQDAAIADRDAST
jgi:hypothetical protein